MQSRKVTSISHEGSYPARINQSNDLASVIEPLSVKVYA